MLNIVNPENKFDFMAKRQVFSKVSLALVGAAIVIIAGFGLQFGLDFSGGHEILVSFDENANAKSEDVRAAVKALNVGDTAVQSFDIPDVAKTHYLVKVERSETFGDSEIKALNDAFSGAYGDKFKGPIKYNPEAGDVVEVEFVQTATFGAGLVDTSVKALSAVVEKTNHKVRLVRKVGRPDQNRYSIVLMGLDVSVIEALQKEVHESANAERVGFVGPTVGKQLRNDGILACFYALLCILIYIALRFDFFYGPGAIVCLVHDALITIGILALLGHEFSLATIAGLLTLIGYSINDTIVVFDRIRERVGKTQGSALIEVLNRAINETIGRTLMTSLTTGFACICLMWFGQKTVLADFGLIMGIGVIIGTYSSIYVASPVFLSLRTRFGQEQIVGAKKPSQAKKVAKAAS
ncbi:MAG: protein translocase subunit SecF [Myxococcota bacterium]|nr:protein translocase subunit SecF [Myxococcota bacterium]